MFLFNPHTSTLAYDQFFAVFLNFYLVFFRTVLSRTTRYEHPNSEPYLGVSTYDVFDFFKAREDHAGRGSWRKGRLEDLLVRGF